MTYNLSFLEEPSLFGIVQKLNIESGYWLAIMILLSLYVILLISFKNYDTKATLLVTPFLVIIVAGGFYGLGLVNINFIKILLALFVVSILLYLGWDSQS